MFRVNLESITFLKVRKIMYLDKAYIIVKRNVSALSRNKQKYKYTNNMQVMLMRLMSKGEYLIVPKGTKLTGSGKLGLSPLTTDWHPLPHPICHGQVTSMTDTWQHCCFEGALDNYNIIPKLFPKKFGFLYHEKCWQG